MGVKARVGGVWTPISMVVEDAGDIGRVTDVVSLALNGGILADVTVTETANATPITPTETTSANLAPGFTTTTVGTIASSSANFAVTRPTGTASGDLLVMVFFGSNNSAPTITGWTIKDGPSTIVVAGVFAFVYQRIADLTATDTPTVTYANATPTIAGWLVGAIKSGTTVGTVQMNTTGGVATALVGTAITAAANNTLMLSVAIAINGRTISSTTWVLDLAAAGTTYTIGVSHQIFDNGESSGVPTTTLNSSTSVHGVYTMAIT